MPIIFSGVAPHPPLLLPAHASTKEAKSLIKTSDALTALMADLRLSQPETVLVVSHHGPSHPGLTFSTADRMTATFEQFGDLKTTITVNGDLPLATMLYEDLLHQNWPVHLSHSSQWDYGSALPFLFSPKGAQDKESSLPKCITLVPPKGSVDQLRRMANAMADRLHRFPKRIALLASADLSHQLSKDGPGGYSETAVKRLTELLRILETQNVNAAFRLAVRETERLFECGYRTLLFTLALLGENGTKARLLNMESPQGVGYAVMEWGSLR